MVGFCRSSHEIRWSAGDLLTMYIDTCGSRPEEESLVQTWSACFMELLCEMAFSTSPCTRLYVQKDMLRCLEQIYAETADHPFYNGLCAVKKMP